MGIEGHRGPCDSDDSECRAASQQMVNIAMNDKLSTKEDVQRFLKVTALGSVQLRAYAGSALIPSSTVCIPSHPNLR
jgi:hypothetical protein